MLAYHSVVPRVVHISVCRLSLFCLRGACGQVQSGTKKGTHAKRERRRHVRDTRATHTDATDARNHHSMVSCNVPVFALWLQAI